MNDRIAGKNLSDATCPDIKKHARYLLTLHYLTIVFSDVGLNLRCIILLQPTLPLADSNVSKQEDQEFTVI